ncbi:Chaperone protein HtpG [Buchnera aphidicola (Takecallis arundicolens)]|uniref:molecular chaperone HtpG n=1 Tax=Buchnera aphidicola TaxID=9 RepID=UPI003463E1FC
MINTKEKHQFQSETKQLLHLMINSLYSSKEIFIRELISNGSDAIDKMRFTILSKNIDNKLSCNMYIRITLDRKEKKIIISDNGIGMTKNEVIKNLGMIANSGTKKFINTIKNQNNQHNQLIGNFGVGFYSSFMVAEKVVVKTKHMDANQDDYGIIWESDGKGEYIIDKIQKKEHGTDIELYLKSTEIQFLENWKIQNIIEKYSNHISIPIQLQEYDKKNNTVLWKQINQGQALWTRNKLQITKDEYKKFYYSITKDTEKPLIWTHNTVEGTYEYTCLLYIPSKSIWNILDQEKQKNGLKLYVKKIFIMDDANQFLPNYLRFIKGILDTNNLPLNISREILQENKSTNILRISLTKRILKLIKKLSLENPNKYKIFFKEFGPILKEGIAEDTTNQEIIASLLRFTSMKYNSKEQTLSLTEYITNMHAEQNKIYFLIAENYDAANTSPHLEIFRKNKIDVLLLSERIDDWMMHYLTIFQNKKFQSISKFDPDSEKLFGKIDNNINITPEIQDFLNKIQNTLQKHIASVKLSQRLVDSPAVLITDKNAISPQMSKLFKAAGQNIPSIKYIFEINPNHSLIKKIIKIKNTEKINIWIQTLFDQALLSTHGTLKNPNNFIKNINQLLTEK